MIFGLTQRVFYHKQRAYDGLEHGWYNFLKDHTIVTVPNNVDQNFKLLASSIDCLIITGGNDPMVRRITETKLASEMMQQGKPVLGICHGAFLLTELLGGSVDDCSYHMDTEHKVTTKDGVYIVNSYHDYQITEPHNTATILAKDQDGFCEAWIDGSLAGIVWHPERMEVPYVPKEIKQLLNLEG